MATTPAAVTSYFFGARLQNTEPSFGKFQARLGNLGGFSFGTKKSPPTPPPKQKQKFDDGERPVWFPGAEQPEWLDGSLVGHRGFDNLDQNLAKNVAGDVIGSRIEELEMNPTPFQPYSEVFGLQRFRECELIHGRWAMLSALGALAVEGLTGVAWQDGGKDHHTWAFLCPSPYPLSFGSVLVIGYIEFREMLSWTQRKGCTRVVSKFFDPLGQASDPDEKERLQLAEIKHARLAMVVFLIFGIQAAPTGKGTINFVETFNK